MPTQDSQPDSASRSVCALFAAGVVSMLLLSPRLSFGDAVATQPPDKIGSAANFLMLPPDEQPGSFRNTDKLFASRTFKHGANVFPLPRAAKPLTAVSYEFDGKTLGVDDFMTRNRVSGLLIIDHGKIAMERYGLGNTESSRWTSFSVGKSFVSTLVGAAVADGSIHSVEDPITRYLPALKGSAYEGVSVRNMLQMSSGVKWNEDYRQHDSDIGKLLACVAAKTPGCIIGFMRKLPRAAEPGALFNYNTGETHLLGLAVTAATGKHLSDYLSEKIWSRFGMESDGYWSLESTDGAEMAGGSLSMTLRDYGRFGQFILGGGMAGGQQVLPPGWLAEATQPRADSPQVAFGKLDPGDPLGYGYQWWLLPPSPPHVGAFEAEGIFGQFIYVNPQRQIIAVVWSAWPAAWIDENAIETHTFLTAAVESLEGAQSSDLHP